jgi:hypothetical protein
MDKKPQLVVSNRVIAEAMKTPDGWVYEIVGAHSPTEAVPPDAILGAWKVSSNGTLTGEFKANEGFNALKHDFHRPPAWLVAHAKTRPRLWTYEIDEPFVLAESVPKSKIVGAWFADDDGLVTGNFLINPDYMP